MDTPIASSARRPRWLLPAAAVAVVFGVATIVAGARSLVGGAGDAVPFVLWFNFLAGFAYVIAGAALARGRPWGARLALAIVAGTALVDAALGVHVLLGGAVASRTVAAMAVRTTTWLALAVLACRHFSCRRAVRTVAGMAALTLVLVLATTCGRPGAAVKIHAAATPVTTPAHRPLAPRMSARDHKDRELELPVPGRVTVLSFASHQTADRGSERCREVRVAHPDVEVVEVMNVSIAPGFLASKVKRKLAERHEQIMADTTRAFVDAHEAVPADLDKRIHIIPDWTGDAFRAFGATDTDHELEMAVIDDEGGLVEFFATTPSAAALDAAVVRASAARR